MKFVKFKHATGIIVYMHLSLVVAYSCLMKETQELMDSMEHSWSQEPITGPCYEPDKSSLHSYTVWNFALQKFWW